MPPAAVDAAARREAAHLQELSTLLLSWLRLATPAALDAAIARHRPSPSAPPLEALTNLLSDGILLADLLSAVSPSHLPPSTVRRAAPRNALSAPVRPSSPIPNIDARQLSIQYRENVRRTLSAVKKVFEAVRDSSATLSRPGSIDKFAPDAASVPPQKNPLPALRVAELAVAAAVYGPARTRFANLFWHLPSDALRRTFHKSMTAVAQATYLPPPDVLYADGPQSFSPNREPQSAGQVYGANRAAFSPPRPDRQVAPALPADVSYSAGTGEPGQNLSGVPDDGMGLRKFSMVTEDGNVSRESTSPSRLDSPVKLHSPAAVDRTQYPDAHVPALPTSQTQHIVDDDFVESMRALESGRLPTHQHDMLGEAQEFEIQSKSASEEFFTPREHSPSPDRSRITSEETKSRSVVSSRLLDGEGSSRQFSMAAVGLGRNPRADEGFVPHHVDETVRQSVTTSITQQISQVSAFGAADGQKPLGEMSSLDLSSEAHEVGHSVSVESEFLHSRSKPLDFNDPAYMLSPSASDAPSPSNQWQISRQKAMAAEIMSPQQLFSPPQMPKRLSRTAMATQMTPPPGPPLFSAGSPHCSVSSAGARSLLEIEEAQLTNKSQKVSFAPNVISPGGHLRPLGQPLKAAECDSAAAGDSSHTSGDRSFSLPPCAALSENKAQDGRLTLEEQEPKEYDHGREDRDTYREQFGKEDDQMVFDDDDDSREDVETSSSSEKDELEDVGEIAVTSVEQGEKQRFSRQLEGNEGVGEEYCFADKEICYSAPPPISYFGGTASDEGVVRGRPIPSRDLAAASGHEGDIFDEIAALQASGLDSANSSPAESPRAAPVGYRSPSTARRAYHREVPPTPPSPPALAALVESISERRRTAEDIDARPVSTMAPSAGLFQKLISVWQSSDEGVASSSNQEERPTTSISHSSMHESTLLSGDTDLVKDVAMPEKSKSRRPRAIRLAPGLASPHDLQKLSELGRSEEDDGESVLSKGSVASFSDAFSSDKDRNWLYGGRVVGDDWEEAMKGDRNAGIPVSPNPSQEMRRTTPMGGARSSRGSEQRLGREKPPLPPSPGTSGRKPKSKSHSTSTGGKSVVSDGQHIKVDRRRLDWLTRELLSARDVISRQELQMTFAETQRMEQEEVLVLDKQNAESVVEAMKHILSDREKELNESRTRLSVAIQSVSKQRSSVGSRSSSHGESEDLGKLIKDGNANLRSRMDESDSRRKEAMDEMSAEAKGLWSEVQRAMTERMSEMTEKRDAELDILRRELDYRQKLIDELQKSSEKLLSKNDGFHSEVTAMKVEQEKSKHRYQLEMAHVSAQVELVNEFSKKLHDNFRETENLRQQVLQYQDKLSHITSTSGVSQRQIKELREAVTRANDECARLRREADFAKRKGMEAVRRAEELEELRHKDAQANSGRYPDRQDRSDSASYRSHEPVRPPGQNRPGGTSTATRYHAATRARGITGSQTPAQKAWLAIKDKIGGIVIGKEGSSSRRRPTAPNGRRDLSRAGSGSSGSNSRSRHSPRDDEMMRRSRSGSARSRSSGSGSTVRSGTPRSAGSSARRASPVGGMHDSPRGRGDISRIRAVDF